MTTADTEQQHQTIQMTTSAGDEDQSKEPKASDPVTSSKLDQIKQYSQSAKAYVQQVTSTGKPWQELLGQFSMPKGMAEATGRMNKNIKYFSTNYFIIVFCLLMVSIVIRPKSLVVLGLLAGVWVYFFAIRNSPMTIGGRTFGVKEQLLIMTVVSILVIFFLTNVGAIIMYSLIASLALIATHAALRAPYDLFMDDNDSATLETGSFFSFLRPKQGPMTFTV